MLKKKKLTNLSQNYKAINFETFDKSIANVINGVNNNFIDWSPLTSTTSSSVFSTISDLSSNSAINLSAAIDYSTTSNSCFSSSSSSLNNSSIKTNNINALNLSKTTLPTTSSKLNNGFFLFQINKYI